MKFIVNSCPWEDSDFVVEVRPDFERSWKAVVIGGTLSRSDAKRTAEWLQGALPALWQIFSNVQRDGSEEKAESDVGKDKR